VLGVRCEVCDGLECVICAGCYSVILMKECYGVIQFEIH
jgi:hypothetical protein